MNTITNWKGYLVSTLITFVAVFLTTFCAALIMPGFVFSKDTLIALALSGVISGVRAAAKLVIEYVSGIVTNPVSVRKNLL